MCDTSLSLRKAKPLICQVTFSVKFKRFEIKTDCKKKNLAMNNEVTAV